jgi:hypothetical protein
MAQIGVLLALALVGGGSVLKRIMGARAVRAVLASRGWRDVEVRYRPTLAFSKRARFHVSGVLPDGHPRDGFAYVGSFGWAPPFDSTVRLWDPWAPPTDPLHDDPPGRLSPDERGQPEAGRDEAPSQRGL